MPKTILGPAEPIERAAWPYSQRHLLKPAKHLGGQPVQRAFYDNSEWLGCYQNGGRFPEHRDPFGVATFNRRLRRATGQRRNRNLGILPARPALRTKSVEQADAERALRLARRRVERAELQIMPVAQ